MASSASPSRSSYPRRVLYVHRDIEMQSPKEFAAKLQAAARAATGLLILFDCAKDGFEGVDMFHKTNYHAVIVAANLPNLSGLAFVRTLRDTATRAELEVGHRLCPIILIGGSPDETTEEDRRVITRHYRDDDEVPFKGRDLFESLSILFGSTS